MQLSARDEQLKRIKQQLAEEKSTVQLCSRHHTLTDGWLADDGASRPLYQETSEQWRERR